MPRHPPEFMRYTAADTDALMRDIVLTRRKLAEAILEKNALATVDHAADLGSMLTTARKETDWGGAPGKISPRAATPG